MGTEQPRESTEHTGMIVGEEVGAPTVDANMDSRRRAAFIEEAECIKQIARYSSGEQRWQAASWRRWNTLLTGAAAGLAALAGASGLAASTNRTFAGVAALVAGVLSAVSAALGSGSRSKEYYDAASMNLKLANSARVFCRTIAPYLPIEQAAREFTSLCEERDRVITEAPLKLGAASSWWRPKLHHRRPNCD